MELIIPTCVALVCAVVFAFACSKRGSAEQQLVRRWAKRGRALDATPIVGCPEATVVRLIGAVGSHGKPMIAPLSKRPCVHWRLTIACLESTGTRTYWRDVFERVREDPFVLAEPGGTCLIDPALATMQIGGTSATVFRPDGRWPRAIADLVDSDRQLAHTIRNREIRISETIIACGDRIAVVGVGRYASNNTGDYRETAWRLCVSGMDGPCLISNEPTLLQVKRRSFVRRRSLIRVGDFERRIASR